MVNTCSNNTKYKITFSFTISHRKLQTFCDETDFLLAQGLKKGKNWAVYCVARSCAVLRQGKVDMLCLYSSRNGDYIYHKGPCTQQNWMVEIWGQKCNWSHLFLIEIYVLPSIQRPISAQDFHLHNFQSHRWHSKNIRVWCFLNSLPYFHLSKQNNFLTLLNAKKNASLPETFIDKLGPFCGKLIIDMFLREQRS